MRQCTTHHPAASERPRPPGAHQGQIHALGRAPTDERLTQVILHGRNMMPATQINDDQMSDLLAYLHTYDTPAPQRPNPERPSLRRPNSPRRAPPRPLAAARTGAISLYLLVLAGVIILGVVAGRHYPPLFLVFAAIFIAASAG